MKTRYTNIPFALQCAFLFLVLAVFHCGLHAKVALYQSHPGQTSAPSASTKLSVEERSNEMHTISSMAVTPLHLPGEDLLDPHHAVGG